jgi:hypothetical protein
MPRRPRVAPGGHVYHMLNRSVGRMPMFRTDKGTGKRASHRFHKVFLIHRLHQQGKIGQENPGSN